MDALGHHDWHAHTATAALYLLDTRPAGLDEEEAARRLVRSGPNAMPEPRATGVLRAFLGQFASPLVYLLLLAGVLSLVVGDRWDAWFIFGVLITNATISTFQETKADVSARALRSLIPQMAHVRRSGLPRDVPSVEIVPGDIVELQSGMRITADLRLLETLGLQIDEAPLTGESLPVTKDAKLVLSETTTAPDRRNMAFAGTTVAAGRGLAVVVETGRHTRLGHIGISLEEAAHMGIDTPLVRRLAHLARQIAIGAGALILMLSIVLWLQGEEARYILLLAIALAVAAVPEGLPVAVTVALSAASRRMARRNVIVRELPAVEGLGACTLIATDKTGTLTMNRLTVHRVLFPDSAAMEREGWQDRDGSRMLQELSLAAGLCNEAHLTDAGSPVGDAVDVALLQFAREAALHAECGGHGIDANGMIAAERLSIIPYEPELRYAAVEAEYGGETRIVVKGAPETVVPMCSGDTTGLATLADGFAAEGYRVLLLASGGADGRTGHIRDRLQGLTPLGFVGLTDPLRPGVIEAVAHCREAGIDVRMITGDHPATAKAIARQIGLSVNNGSVLTGSELASLSPETLGPRVAAAHVFARIEPEQKLTIVRTLADQGHIVAVTGDGVNDGPALQAADIGIAMGIKGTDVARGAADLILADDNFASIVSGVEEGRITFSNVRKIVLFMLATGVAEIAMFLAALAAGLPLPLTPIQLLWLNLVTNGVQDITLGFGRGEGDELKHPPRRALAMLVDREALILMAPGALVMTILAIWMLDAQLSAGQSLNDARNAVLLMVVLFQNAFLLAVRHLRSPFWRWRAPENGWLFAGLGTALALQAGAMHLPFTQRVLGIHAVDAAVLVQCLGAALLVLLVTEAAKIFIYRAPAPER
ncbi:HAD family hydrolase [Croceicoccus ponticola]|uniref:HAD family hydrolase n=1 Tax=Croceicoccus ponticola TaxID=2217664 RepID=A0A437H1V9_9SPHN|nr:HAD-IC family P-type ATPase [Croceicoccus ponticola]RVQ69615.1 HAD family hydrolase [Croceicoccus ponticola]